MGTTLADPTTRAEKLFPVVWHLNGKTPKEASCLQKASLDNISE
jgi:hypothetical protein